MFKLLIDLVGSVDPGVRRVSRSWNSTVCMVGPISLSLSDFSCDFLLSKSQLKTSQKFLEILEVAYFNVHHVYINIIPWCAMMCHGAPFRLRAEAPRFGGRPFFNILYICNGSQVSWNATTGRASASFDVCKAKNQKLKGCKMQNTTPAHPEERGKNRFFFSQSNTEYERLKKLIGQVNQLEPSENGPDPRTNLGKPIWCTRSGTTWTRCSSLHLRSHEGSVRSHRKMGSCPLGPLLEV